MPPAARMARVDLFMSVHSIDDGMIVAYLDVMKYDLDHNKLELASPFDGLARTFFRVTECPAETVLFHQDSPTSGMFQVLSGAIELRRHTDAGAVVVLHRAGAGETFAEASLFAEHYHCDAVAVVDSRVVRIDRRAVLDQMKDDPEFAIEVAGRFARQVQMGRRHVELLSVKKAKERVYLALADGLLSDSVVGFARRIGLTHETTYRALAELVRSGIVNKTGRGGYEVCNTLQINSKPTPANTS